MTTYHDPVFAQHNPLGKIGFIDLPIGSMREITSGSVINAAGHGGNLASDTTPILDTVNGDTDGAWRLEWVADDVDAIGFQVKLPPDFDVNSPLLLKFWAEMSGTTPWDTCTVASDTYFNFGDTKVEDTVAITGGTLVTWTLTIAAADIPADAVTVSVELTPGAHANDDLYVMAMWLEYTKL